MAEQFFDREAELGSDESDYEEGKEEARRKKSAFRDDSDDEEEEDDEEKIRSEMKDLINDDEDDEEEEDDDEVTGKKRSHEDELDDDLDEEDYDLLEDNLGTRIKRKKKFRRVRRLADDDEDEEKEENRDADDREEIERELFGDEDEPAQSKGDQRRDRGDREAIDDRFGELSGSGSEESEDDFIVDDDDRPIAQTRVRKKKSERYTDQALQQAQDIFGVDFDYDDVRKYDEDEYEEEGEEDEVDEYEDPDDIEKIRRKKIKKKSSARKSIFEIYEPSELERSHLTKVDNEIRNTDMPERFQLRSIAVTNCDEKEIEEEAEWVYTNAFSNQTISYQYKDMGDMKRAPIAGQKNRESIPKIQNALRFMRNDFLEVPFISFYRKEYIEPDLNINDLWVVYKWDEKWCQLQQRKKNLSNLFKDMQEYLNEKYLKGHDLSFVPEGVRLITELDIERISQVHSFEELRDCWCQFQLYYSNEVNPMKQEKLKREREKRLENVTEEDAERIMNEEDELINAKLSSMKLAPRKDSYTICKEAGITYMAAKIGLLPEQIGENIRDNYQRHEVDQCATEPLELAHTYLSQRFQTEQDVLEAVKFIVAKQISCDPLVRKCVRTIYFERAKLHCKPTKKGLKEIEEGHPCYNYKYLMNKPVTDFEKDEFLQLVNAKSDGLMEFQITIDKLDVSKDASNQRSHTYLDEIKTLFHRDEFSINVQEWNQLREQSLALALEKFLYPCFEKELTTKLLNEAHDGIIKECSEKLFNWLKVAPYSVPDEFKDAFDEDEDFSLSDGIRIMGFSFVPSNDDATFAAILNAEGEEDGFLKLEYFMLKRSEWSTEQEKTLREKDKEKLKRFIASKKPHVIVVGVDTIVTRYVVEDLQNIIQDLYETESFPKIPIEVMDNDLATVYMNSKRAQTDFHNYPPQLRQAISIARKLLDPLVEYSQLCTADEEILCLKYHHMQIHIPKEDLLSAIYLQFVNRINEVGVDINRAITHPHTANMVQFIGGLGPRKGTYLLRQLKKQQTPLLENRTQLVQNCNIGKIVFINCAGFIKIDTASLSDTGTDTYIEVLDSTRVHPEGYEWARKMAVDALEYDEDNDTNPAQALEEIIDNPEKLKDLDLDAFADELQRQGMGFKRITLYDIRAELTHRYKDLREPYRSPTQTELFHLYTKETEESLYVGKLLMAKVIGIARRKPQSDQLDSAAPIRNEDTGLWKCPFCFKEDFAELSEVWNHFDESRCPGQAIGVKLRLDNGLIGLVQTANLSDKEVADPSERVKEGMTIHCRVIKVIDEKFSVDLTCKTSDLNDTYHTWRQPKDKYYCYEAEDKDNNLEEEHKKKQSRQTYIKRIIVHPSFHNIDFKQSEKKLATMNQGESIIRPSSKSSDHLTLSWKVLDGIHAHIDIREEGKDNAFSLGRQLYIGNEAYEDLDEIIARYVQPMASYARDLVNFKYFKDLGGKKDVIAQLLKEEKLKVPSRIPYIISASKEYPGKFVLSYMPNNQAKHEYIKLTPDGLVYRTITFRSINHLFKWFKTHFNDKSTFPRTPVATPAMRTPMGQSSTYSSSTPSNIDPQALKRAAAAMPSHMFNTLSQVAGQTPSFGGAAAAFGASQSSSSSMPPPFPPNRNYYGQATPSGTPMMTPHMTTPRSYTNSNTTPMGPPHRPGSRSGADWSSMAESWGHKSASKPRTPSYNTPGASSQMSISPNTNTPNARGDQTPLVDEWN